MKDFKTLPKMKTGGKVKKYEDGGKVYLGKAPEKGTIVRENPERNSDGNIYWTGSEPTAADKFKKGISDLVESTGDTIRKAFGNKDKTLKETLNSGFDKKKRGGKITKKKK